MATDRADDGDGDGDDDGDDGAGLLDTDKIRRLRGAKGLTQERAAVAAGFKGRAAWSNFESGQQTAITLATLAKLARVLGVDARDLLRPGPAPLPVGGEAQAAPAAGKGTAKTKAKPAAKTKR